MPFANSNAAPLDAGSHRPTGVEGQGGAYTAPAPHVLPFMFPRLREDINCILERDPAARSRWEVLTCYPGLHALVLQRQANRCWRHGWFWLGRFISHVARFLTGIEIHPGATIGRRVFIDHGMGVVIGETAVIGDDCTIYQGVTLGGTSLEKGAKRHPTLGQGVIVGANAQVLGSFTVGDGARIGSNAVVVKPVPAGATAVGATARILEKDRSAAAQPADGPSRADGAGQKGFSAYGTTQSDDSMSQAMKALIENAEGTSEQLTLVWNAIEKLSQMHAARTPAREDMLEAVSAEDSASPKAAAHAARGPQGPHGHADFVDSSHPPIDFDADRLKRLMK